MNASGHPGSCGAEFIAYILKQLALRLWKTLRKNFKWINRSVGILAIRSLFVIDGKPGFSVHLGVICHDNRPLCFEHLVLDVVGVLPQGS